MSTHNAIHIPTLLASVNANVQNATNALSVAEGNAVNLPLMQRLGTALEDATQALTETAAFIRHILTERMNGDDLLSAFMDGAVAMANSHGVELDPDNMDEQETESIMELWHASRTRAKRVDQTGALETITPQADPVADELTRQNAAMYGDKSVANDTMPEPAPERSPLAQRVSDAFDASNAVRAELESKVLAADNLHNEVRRILKCGAGELLTAAAARVMQERGNFEVTHQGLLTSFERDSAAVVGERYTASHYLHCLADHASLLPATRAALILMSERMEKLEQFKAYTHQRLDEADVPTHPDGVHGECRIGNRLDYVFAESAHYKNVAQRAVNEQVTAFPQGMTPTAEMLMTGNAMDGCANAEGMQEFIQQHGCTPAEHKQRMERWFCYDAEGTFTTHHSEVQARAEAQRQVDDCRTIAKEDGEWPDTVTGICVGRITSVVVCSQIEQEDHSNNQPCDYALAHLPAVVPGEAERVAGYLEAAHTNLDGILRDNVQATPVANTMRGAMDAIEAAQRWILAQDDTTHKTLNELRAEEGIAPLVPVGVQMLETPVRSALSSSMLALNGILDSYPLPQAVRVTLAGVVDELRRAEGNCMPDVVSSTSATAPLMVTAETYMVLDAIAQERAHQIALGYDAQHDGTEETPVRLACAAACIATAADLGIPAWDTGAHRSVWPWDNLPPHGDMAHYHAKPMRDRLRIAAALLVAAIELGDRANWGVDMADEDATPQFNSRNNAKAPADVPTNGPHSAAPAESVGTNGPQHAPDPDVLLDLLRKGIALMDKVERYIITCSADRTAQRIMAEKWQELFTAAVDAKANMQVSRNMARMELARTIKRMQALETALQNKPGYGYVMGAFMLGTFLTALVAVSTMLAQ